METNPDFNDGTREQRKEEALKIIRSIDDGGSFERLVAYCKQRPEEERLLERIIVSQFINRLMKESGISRKIDDGKKIDDRLGFFAPRKKGTGLLIKKPDDGFMQAKEEEMMLSKLKKTERWLESDEQKKKPKKLKIEKKEIVKAKRVKIINFKKLLAGLDPPDMPKDLKERIEGGGGTDIKLVIMKQVFESDLNKDLDRFSIPEKQVWNPEFITDNEKEHLLEDNKSINISLIEPCGLESGKKFKRWKMNKSYNYVINPGWSSVFEREENQLKQNGSIVQLWSFRREKDLCFALIHVRKGNSDAVTAGQQHREDDEGDSSSHSTVLN